jgi:ADP-ribose pyrophosphatase
LHFLQEQRLIRESVKHPGAVVIVPMLDRQRIVFVSQYRRAVDRELLELPAGTLSPGEPRLACAKRELQEETGWAATRWRRLGRFYAAPGFISEQLTLFLAQGLRKAPAHPDPDEFVRPVVLTMTDAVRRIHSGSICDAKSIIGVLFARRLMGRGR